MFNSISQAYFSGLQDGNFAAVPWSADAVLHTPLAPSPIAGRDAIEAFFRPLAGQLGSIALLAVYPNAAGDSWVAEARVGPLHVMDKFVWRDHQIVEQHNVFDPRPALAAPTPETTAPGALTATERAALLEALESSRDSLRAALQQLDPSRFLAAPAPGAWSAAQCAEHLILSEDALLGMVRQFLANDGDPSIAAETAGKEALVIRAERDRSLKSATFDFLEPTGRWTTPAVALDAFLARRADTLDFVRSTVLPLHHHGAPLGAFGLLSTHQWLLLMAEHTGRHIAQIREAAGEAR